LNELEARQRGIQVRVAKLPARVVLRARATGETRGFLKALVDAQRDDILGFTMFAADGGEVLAAVQMAMLAGLPYTALREAIFTHPTMAESLKDLFDLIPERSLGQ
jgi:pyruvate/2-oxoglutarate dehydrogenase complex dihydrolipoamide dehydrogenase (E3) component